jgi:hypothetical protein
MIARRILDAQDEDCEASELAQIAEEHSIWSQKLAHAQAHKDYYTAYHPHLASTVLSATPALSNCHKALARSNNNNNNKRSLNSLGRRVRCRMF